jgi:hypothetical protein
MGQSTSLSLRQSVINLRSEGLSLVAISEQTGVPYGTVQRLCSHHKKSGGDWDLTPNYAACGKVGANRSDWCYRASLWLRRLHPQWGAPLIRLKLQQKYPDRLVASERTIQYWIKASVLPKSRNKVPKEPKIWAQLPHDIWQTDGKEQQKLCDGRPFCWLTMTDERSGGVIETPLFPL